MQPAEENPHTARDGAAIGCVSCALAHSVLPCPLAGASQLQDQIMLFCGVLYLKRMSQGQSCTL